MIPNNGRQKLIVQNVPHDLTDYNVSPGLETNDDAQYRRREVLCKTLIFENAFRSDHDRGPQTVFRPRKQSPKQGLRVDVISCVATRNA